MEEEEYTPLTCDMCSQTFNRPSDWVRHIEFTHADMTENRRKRRKVCTWQHVLVSTRDNNVRQTLLETERRVFRTTWTTTAKTSRRWSATCAVTCTPRRRNGYVIYKRSTRRSSWPWWTTRRHLSRRGFTITKSYATYVKRNSRVTPRWSSTRERIQERSPSSVPTVKKASTWRAICWGTWGHCMTNTYILACTGVTVARMLKSPPHISFRDACMFPFLHGSVVERDRNTVSFCKFNIMSVDWPRNLYCIMYSDAKSDSRDDEEDREICVSPLIGKSLSAS